MTAISIPLHHLLFATTSLFWNILELDQSRYSIYSRGQQTSLVNWQISILGFAGHTVLWQLLNSAIRAESSHQSISKTNDYDHFNKFLKILSKHRANKTLFMDIEIWMSHFSCVIKYYPFLMFLKNNFKDIKTILSSWV